MIASASYFAAVALAHFLELLPNAPNKLLVWLLGSSATLLYIADYRIRKKFDIRTHLSFKPDSQGKLGWVFTLFLVAIGIFLQSRVTTMQAYYPWLYAIVVFVWTAAAIDTLKYFRRMQ